MWTRGLGTRLDPAALDEVDRRVEDHLIARLNAVARLDLRSEIARHRYLSNMRDTILDHGDVQPIAVEDACVRRREPLRFRETESMRSSHRMFTRNLSANRTMSDRPASKPLRKRTPFRRQGRQSFRLSGIIRMRMGLHNGLIRSASSCSSAARPACPDELPSNTGLGFIPTGRIRPCRTGIYKFRSRPTSTPNMARPYGCTAEWPARVRG
jgi:hypothetical protein